MKNISFNIIPYHNNYEEALMALEHDTPQGSYVKLEMIKPYFLSRSDIFEDYSIFLAIEKFSNKLIGVIAATILPLKINNEQKMMGFGYDFKVAPHYRNLGIAKKLEKYQIKHYFSRNDIQNYFTVTKSSNLPIRNVILSIPKQMEITPFLYLTIPTNKSAKLSRLKSTHQRFSVGLYTKNKNLEKYIIKGTSGLTAWRTLDCYKLRIQNISWLLRVNHSWMKFLIPEKAAVLQKGKVLNFATLYNFDSTNIYGINEFLVMLHDLGIPYLNVCCAKNDFVYKLLKPIALSITPYNLFDTLGNTNRKNIGIDVRCL